MDMSAFVGVPYKLGGRDMSGLDCYGFVRLVLADVDIHLPLFAELDRGVDMEAEAFRLTEWDLIDAPQNYALVYFSMQGHRGHVGVYLDGLLWHFSYNGVVSLPWHRTKGRVKGAYRVKG